VDTFGRAVADVSIDGHDLSRALVRRGLATWHACFAPHDDDLRSLQAMAQDSRRGLWAVHPPRLSSDAPSTTAPTLCPAAPSATRARALRHLQSCARTR
jgi:endonuclease YncB( thermonuclease family)